MRRSMTRWLLVIAGSVVFLGCNVNNESKSIEEPVARKEDKSLSLHGDTRVDPYYWMRDREDPEVIDYLNAENAYTDAILADTKTLQEDLYQEIRGRMREDRQGAPTLDNGYWYYYRYDKGDEYPVYLRRKDVEGAPEEVLLDVRALAKGHEFTQVRGLDVSRDNRWLIYSRDHIGRRQYDLVVVDLENNASFDTGIKNVGTDAHWANDNQTFFYTAKDPETLRSAYVYRAKFTGGETSSPQLVFDETDETFSVGVGRTRRADYLVFVSGSTVATEYRLLDASNPTAEAEVFLPRERDHEYYLDYDGESFFVVSNKDAKNFRLLQASAIGQDMADWKEIVPHRDDTLLENFELFKDFIAVEEKTGGLTRIQLINREDDSRHYLDFGEQTYSAYLTSNDEYTLGTLRYGYESMTVPDSIFDYDVAARERVLVKQEEVLGGFDASEYQSERLMVPARDGVKVPVSVVYRKDTPRDGTAPILQYAYGSYGYSIDPGFSYSRISLLDRGFVFAIAHIRGGSDLGRAWYDDGKLFNKKNTFTDFIDVSAYLVENNYVAPDAVYAMGGSAGGLLMGAVMNMAPDQYQGVVAQVPFVDVITTMLDDSIPLTTGEYDEWGNPNQKDYYDYMLSYSPYDNVTAKAYPNVLITTGLHDSQVQYWEPAKWAAKLRDYRVGDSLVLLKTNMDAGHGGASGRFEAIRETALEYAFLIKLEGERSRDAH